MIKNLLFDLGGVIMNLDRMRAVRNLKKLGMEDADTVLGQYAQQGPFALLESGTISPDEFHRRMIALIPGGADPEAVDEAFISFLDGIPTHRLRALRELRENFRLFMLSNTNAIMWETEIKRQFAQEGLGIADYFDGVVTSYTTGVMKPDARIFEITEERLAIRPAETLFLDDSQANCDAATRLGWHAACVEPGKEFTEVIYEFLNSFDE